MTKTFKDIQGIEEACWVGYKKVGMKKGDRMVPNCVKEEVVDSLLGKDYVYENVGDMYKGQFTKAQLAKMKQTWATKKASDVDQRTKDFVKNLDQFSQMDIKNANIKYISALVEEVEKEEFELVSDFSSIVEENEMRVLVRKNKDLKEYFSASQLERLAKAYSVMKDRTISVSNAQKLGKMVDGIPDNALNDLRKKNIPFISGLALSRMIKRKIPVSESTYENKEQLQEVKVYRVSHPSKKTYEVEGDNEKEAIMRYKNQVGLKSDSGIKTLLIKDHGEEIKEADLSKSQVKKVHKQADDLPKKDFIKRYGKDGDSVRYATATNMVKKKLGLGENNFIKKGELKMNDSYKQRLTSAMEHFSISSLGELNEDDHKTFFSYVDDMKEGLSAAQKKLPPALQKAIAKKMKDKSEMHDMKKKEMKEEDAYDGTPAEVAKMKAKEKADAEKAKSKKDEMMAGKKMNAMKEPMNAMANMNAMKEPMNAMMMKAMKMPIRAMKMPEDLVGGQKKLDKDKDGDLDAKDFAMLRKKEGSMKKEYGSMNAMKMKKEEKTKETDSEPKMKDLNAMVKSSHKPDHKGNPIDDMNAGYMKSNVKAAVKDNGGADMAVVKDTPEMMNAMMKISKEKKMVNMKAMYGESRENAKRYLDTKPGSIEEAVLKSRGLIKKSLTEARYEIEGKVNYRGIGSEDAFHMVINANSEKDAEDKADDELRKARNKRKIGPGGGGNIDEVEIESVERTNDKLSAPETYRPGN